MAEERQPRREVVRSGGALDIRLQAKPLINYFKDNYFLELFAHISSHVPAFHAPFVYLFICFCV